jgi:hypothetical protein
MWTKKKCHLTTFNTTQVQDFIKIYTVILKMKCMALQGTLVLVALLATYFMLVSCVAYPLTLKMEMIYSS